MHKNEITTKYFQNSKPHKNFEIDINKEEKFRLHTITNEETLSNKEFLKNMGKSYNPLYVKLNNISFLSLLSQKMPELIFFK